MTEEVMGVCRARNDVVAFVVTFSRPNLTSSTPTIVFNICLTYFSNKNFQFYGLDFIKFKIRLG